MIREIKKCFLGENSGSCACIKLKDFLRNIRALVEDFSRALAWLCCPSASVAPPREQREWVWHFDFPQEINVAMLWVLIHKVAEYTRCRCKTASNFDTYLLEIIMINRTNADLDLFY